jgi:hypothetical protein
MMMKRVSYSRRAGLLPVSLALTALVLALAGPVAAAEFDAEKYFKGKTITLVVDFKPGGGTDTQARYFASNWGRFIPGNPKVKVTNLFPNPSGVNYMAKTKPDGLTLSFLASPNVGVELVNPQVDFENAKLTRIGAHAKRDVSLLVRGTLPYDSLLEARGGKAPITLAEPISSIKKLDGKLLAIGMLAMWMDAPLKIVPVARSGTGDTLLLLERGDINAWIAGSQWYQLPKLRPGWLKDGYLKPIAYMGNPEVPASPNSETEMTVPNAYTWLTDEQKEIWEGIYLPEVISGKNIVGPPDMPAEVTQVLRDAYADAVNDPAFAEGLEKIQGEPPSLIRGEDLQRMIVKSTVAFKKQLPHYEKIRQQVFDLYFK